MADVPSLHEIAAMPFPASVEAMRKHYVHDWGKPVPDGVSRKATFNVAVDYQVSTKESRTIQVEAFTEEEAEEAASDQVCLDNRHAFDVEVLSATAKPVGDA